MLPEVNIRPNGVLTGEGHTPIDVSYYRDNWQRSGGKDKAYYLHYPNFVGSASNALVVGGKDLGAPLTKMGVQLPVGHDAVILMEGNKPHYIEYGRYAGDTGDTKIIGHKKDSVKKGNWRMNTSLPYKKDNETDSAYISRIYKLLPDAETGVTQATVVPNIDA